MLTFESFTGINNVLPEHRMSSKDLVRAQNVDIGLTGEIVRRGGYAEVSALCHKNLHQAPDFMLATCGSELTAIHPDGARHIIHPAMGPRARVVLRPAGWAHYVHERADPRRHGRTRSAWTGSVEAPESLGAPDVAFGSLYPGQYRYHLTHVRLADRLEGPALSSQPITIAQGGLRLDGLPVLEGHATNVYLSGQDGEGAYLAGVATGGSFEYTGNNATLVLPCRTLGAQPFPVGKITAFWRGRVLVAQGEVLWASRPSAPHLADWRDFKPLGAAITAIQPVDDGVYVGTTQDLIFLAGTTWDALAYVPTRRGPVVRGSGVAAPGDRLKLGDGTGAGTAMLCIAGGEIVAGFTGGQTTSLTGNRFRATPAEVCATFREVGGIPQYLAVPQ